MEYIITGDEIESAYDPETTDQSSEYCAKGKSRPKRLRQNRSKIKVVNNFLQLSSCGAL